MTMTILFILGLLFTGWSVWAAFDAAAAIETKQKPSGWKAWQIWGLFK